MSEHTRTGPYEDGTYRYRGWRLVHRLCHAAYQEYLGFPCPWHRGDEPLWLAFPPHEVDWPSFLRICGSRGTPEQIKQVPVLAHHVFPVTRLQLSIEEDIDLWEASNERLFREAFAQAVREP